MDVIIQQQMDLSKKRKQLEAYQAVSLMQFY